MSELMEAVEATPRCVAGQGGGCVSEGTLQWWEGAGGVAREHAKRARTARPLRGLAGTPLALVAKGALLDMACLKAKRAPRTGFGQQTNFQSL